MLKGIGLSPGLAAGKLKILAAAPLPGRAGRLLEDNAIAAEHDKALAALRAAGEEIRRTGELAGARLGPDEAAIFEAHLLMLEDPSVRELLDRKITGEKKDAVRAAAETFEELAALMDGQEDEYFRARAQDIRDVGQRVLAALAPAEADDGPLEGCIVAGRELTPSQAVKLASAGVAGFITEQGGPTSHLAILAKALELPVVSGVAGLETALAGATAVLVDGTAGRVVLDPGPADLARCAAWAEAKARRAAVRIAGDTETRDGRRIEVAANLVSLAEVKRAALIGAEGVGLLRTEFLYLDRPQAPGEEEQYQAYRSVLAAFGDKPVVIRTLDAGGDKPLPYLSMPREDNPFLGIRGLRLSLRERALFKIQLRALLRAAPAGNLRVMYPMVTDIAEVLAARKIMAQALGELQAAGIPCALPRQTGIMVEVPAAALGAAALAEEVDFFSIGTNDLTQYVLAADRGNPAVAALYDSCHPAVLRLIGMVAAAADRAGKWTGVCGELAGDAAAIPLLIGLGVRELSMSPPLIPAAREKIAALAAADAAALAARALACGDAPAVRRLLAD